MNFQRYLVFTLTILLFPFLIINFYFIQMIIENSKAYSSNIFSFVKNSSKGIKLNLKSNDLSIKVSEVKMLQEKILNELKILPSRYFKQDSKNTDLLKNIFMELKIVKNTNHKFMNIIENWPTERQLLPSYAPELGTIINSLRNLDIARTENARIGTQLKLMLTFSNGLKALFKPQWYTRTTKIIGPVYYGKDRHNGEVAAFYLALLLSLRRAPLALIRKLQLREVERSATPELLSTVFQRDNTTCFYGICHYCSPRDPICGIGNILEGVIILWLPPNFKLLKYKHPWQRTYSKTRFALWEIDVNYCDKVKQSKAYSPQYSSRLLDLIDTAIFDFLIDNGDRHHYELLQSNFSNPAILLIDNGKSFGNPDIDHIDILAPLYQCCIVHKSTWEQLKLLSGGSLSYSLKKLLAHEAAMANISLLITKEHLNAVDRRLLTVFAVVEFCLKKNQYSS